MLLAKIFGTKSQREIKKIIPLVHQINEFYDGLSSKSDEYLSNRTIELKTIITSEIGKKLDLIKKDYEGKELKEQMHQARQVILDSVLIESFAIVKETCRRMCGSSWRVTGQEITWEMIPYDVQIMGAIILHQGKVAEMKTGEGKTLVATMPIFLNALTGRGVHIITVNDYLAQRDSEWMGEVYKRLGLSVGFILNSMDNAKRREMYNRDIVYGTNNEFGFDFLRDNMALHKDDLVQREHAFAVVDEVDSVLIDEARTPLIISGAVDTPVDDTFQKLKPEVQALVKRQSMLVSDLVSQAKDFLSDDKREEAGLKLLQCSRGMPKHKQVMKIFQETGMLALSQEVESNYIRDKKLHEVDDELFFSIDEKSHVIDITGKGRKLLSPDSPDAFIIPDLGEMLMEIDEKNNLTKLQQDQEKEKAHQLHADRSGTIHNFNQLLRAYTMYEKDVDYVIQDKKVMIVDEFTGRVLPGRRYSDGLHQALEAKENVRIERETQTLATITIQNYFRLYDKLAGMTGTAETESEELGSIYSLGVTVIPTHRPVSRDDRDDLVYKTKREKYNAVIDEISECHNNLQPVLVGTVTVEVSELLSRMLKRKNIPHNVLNAKKHKSEAEIVSRAGQPGAVTIATNMAGRGTDIKLNKEVIELGGLHIIGTERHESRRIDLQLRGRSGRQGDSGSSRFYLSLEDDLMRLFGSDKVASIMDRMGVEEGEVISAGMVTRAIGNAQKKVEIRNFGIRKHLLEYDDVMNQQRQVVYDLRKQALSGEDMQKNVTQIIDDYIMDELEIQSESGSLDNWDWDHLKQAFSSHLMVDISYEKIKNNLEEESSISKVGNYIIQEAKSVYKARESLIPEDMIRGFERFVILRTIDEKWKDHLYAMDQLREGINLRAYGQKNPLLEYKSEGFQLFQEMIADMNSVTVQRLFRTQIQGADQSQNHSRSVRNIKMQHQDTSGMGYSGTEPNARQQNNQTPQARSPIKAENKVGRNEKIKVESPDGKQIYVKYKKLQSYLSQGFKQV